MSRIGESGGSGSSGAGSGGKPDGGAGAKVGEAAQQVTHDLRELGGQVREAAREKYEQLSENARNYYDEGRRAAQEWEHGVESFIQEKPVQAVLIAAGVGLLLGLLWKR